MRLLEESEDQNEAIFAEVKKDASVPLQESSCACGNLLVSWNGLQMQVTSSKDARLAAELFSHLRHLC